MTSYTVFRVKDALPEDFQAEIPKERLVIYARHFLENGNEVRAEQYDEHGVLLSRSEHRFDSEGREIEAREFMSEEEHPFKVKLITYNEAGKVLSVRCIYEEEEMIAETYKYDHLGRIVSAGFLDEDGNGQSQIWTYEGTCPEPHSMFEYAGEKCIREHTYKYKVKLGRYEIVEQISDDKDNCYDSRIFRFYERGEIPNGVVQEMYNAEGNFLEEVRETADEKGNVLRRTWHTDDSEGSMPHDAHLFKYDLKRNCIYEEFQTNRGIGEIKFWAYDSQNRKIREYFEGVPGAMFIYEYQD